ncbi:MAG: PRD domain-containing protein [Furfurilactobacillus sp.]|jgi:transcriptional antiterminator|uniref:BglG family transcription antiterminator n=1 Tax=Furfurilactobacillus sp. TaxID=2767911 RepID=UPI00258D5174|nr:PRD domain-containing protein [Furfurilactobacillus sp.]MCH4010928.1 PRD domain-containing protein [Furfurilactobacillus sp.]MCH4036820.1 PRD domain-containing protein [Furfurilactobacillus sp.]MCH4114234.1 PRD domain-containing protein [Furfurilactobacillus sp.]MCH4132943.1 PRD domain-containing protein [Furfurilactobacillus sp.]MCI1339375.1 PRD domain-containing protein [Furfurilactobacillus sp.]
MTNYDQNLLNLMLAETSYRSADYYANALGVSKKTIYNHSKGVETYLNNHGLFLERMPRKGYLITGSSEKKQHLRLILGRKVATQLDTKFTPQYRRLYLFAQLLFSDRNSYRVYAESFFVSVQSIKKDFDEINAFLRDKKISLPDQTSLVHSFEVEIKIEQAFKEYLDMYLAHSDLKQSQLFAIFGTAIFEISTNFVDDNSAQDAHVQDEYLPDSLRELLLIFLNRVRHGLHLTGTKNQIIVFEFQKDTDLSRVVSNLAETCKSHAGVTFTNENLRFLNLLLLGHGISSNPNNFSSKYDFTIAAKHLIERVGQELETDFNTDSELLKVTIYHLIPMVARLNLGLHITDSLKSEIFAHHRVIAQTVKRSADELETHYHINLYDDEVSLLSLHFLVAAERHRRSNHVLVVCHAGAEISQFVLLSLQNNLPSNNEMTLIAPSELSKTDLTKFDLVVSTTTIVDRTIPVMYVSVLPREEEISTIYWKLVDVYRKRFKTMRNL